MSSSTEPRGNFIAGQNRSKKPGTNYPDFTGRIGIPGRGHENGCAIWMGRDKNGKLYISGRMNPTPITNDVMAQLESMTEQLVQDATDMATGAANLALQPFQIVGFPNKFKQPDPADSPEEAAKRAKRPDFWARVHPGDGSPVFQVSIWTSQDRYGRPILRGATSYPQPGRNTAETMAYEAAGHENIPFDAEQSR
jgi:hypothetical protein